MNLYEWDLSLLYDSFSSPEFLNDLENAKFICKNLIDRYCGDNDTSSYIYEFLNGLEELLKIYSEISSFVTLSLLINCNNEQAKYYYDEILEIQSYIDEIKNTIYYKIDLSNIDMEKLNNYEYFFMDLANSRKHLMSLETEKVVANLRKSGSYAWQNLRNYLDGNAKGEICIGENIEVYSLSEIRNMASSVDENVRKKAFEAEIKIYKNIEDYAAACFNGIKGDAIALYKPRGFNSVLENMLFVNKMDYETLEKMINAIKEYLPIFQQYYKVKAKLMGKEKLCYYDLAAPIDESTIKYSFEDARHILVSTFKDVDCELGDFIDRAFQENWFDVFSRQGKVGGALCADLPTKGCSKIFLNYNGSFSGIRNCAHELGHAYHGQCINHVPLLIRDVPTPVCETAAIFNEILFQQKILENEDYNKLTVLDASLSESMQTIVDIYSRFLFEESVFKIREKRTLTVDEINKLMCEAQLQAYGDSIDENFLHPYMWICKPHYYITDYHYYNFPYIFGLLFAKGLYAKYQEEGKSFFKKYKTFLSNTCSGNIANIANSIGINVHDEQFWIKSLENIKTDIDLFLRLSKEY